MTTQRRCRQVAASPPSKVTCDFGSLNLEKVPSVCSRGGSHSGLAWLKSPAAACLMVGKWKPAIIILILARVASSPPASPHHIFKPAALLNVHAPRSTLPGWMAVLSRQRLQRTRRPRGKVRIYALIPRGHLEAAVRPDSD